MLTLSPLFPVSIYYHTYISIQRAKRIFQLVLFVPFVLFLTAIMLMERSADRAGLLLYGRE